MNNLIKFVDLETGNVFDGSAPYVFWFDGEQSTNIIYSKSICFISHNSEANISFRNNSIFKLVNPEKIQNINVEYDYNNILCHDNNVTVKGKEYNGYYIYIIYFIGSSSQAGEFIDYFSIDNNEYSIGADFYEAEESLYINLSNKGIEIPESIQKALYNTNVLEDNRDNILLNRKWKELLSNYWDIIACRGSYKSLYNSLKWFEYGDLLKIKELWGRQEGNDKIYSEYDLRSITDNFYNDKFNNFFKTTYIAIRCALQKISRNDQNEVIYDDEKNPKLEQQIFNWSIEDMSLKLCLLGYFFKTYFMPIHLDLIQNSIESVVFTNTFKTLSNGKIDRRNYIYHTKDIVCNIKDKSSFQLGKVQCYITNQTLFGVPASDNTDNIIGVQMEPIYTVKSNDELGKYFSYLYHDIGSIIHFDIKIPLEKGDFIKNEIAIITRKSNQSTKHINDFKIFKIDEDIEKDGIKNISFNILCKYEDEYSLKLQFNSANGYIYTKKIDFSVIDMNNLELKIYKIKNKDSKDFDKYKHKLGTNKYMFSRSSSNNSKIFYQYISAQNPKSGNINEDYNGVKLNHMLILNDSDKTFENSNNNSELMNDYSYIGTKGNKSIFISKEFNHQFVKENYKLSMSNIYKEEYIYVEENHFLDEFGVQDSKSITDFTITDEDSLCIIPNLPISKKINYYEWEFINMSSLDKKSIKLDTSIQEPFIAPTKKQFLEPGYYSIIFRYKLGNQINEIRLDSAFRKV